MESNGTGNAVSSTDIWTWVLRNPSTKAGFYVAQHAKSSSRAVTTFSINLNTTAGAITVPNVTLNGRQSKIIVTDYHFSSQTLLYSTADVLTYGVFQHQAVLVLYLQAGQTGSFAFKSSQRLENTYGSTKVTTNSTGKYYTYTYTQATGSTVLKFSNSLVVYLLDVPSAWNFFAPPTTLDPYVAPNEQVFVLGPYLVRNATVSGHTLAMVGDNANATTIEAWGGSSSVNTLSWNGVSLPTKKTAYGSLVASIPGVANRAVDLPVLSSWEVSDSLPEASRGYDDSKWVVCNKTTTLSSTKPLTLPVLFSSDYGYYAGIKVYRGYFNGKTAASANVTVQGGLASGWSAWLNGKLVGGSPGNASLSATSNLLDFSSATLYDTDNVLTVVTDYTGHDETSTGPSGAENPRGLLGAVLYSNNGTQNFTTWKIQGNAGGNSNIDPVRGILNEDGLYAVRIGAHLPGFDTTSAPGNSSSWTSGSPSEGLNASGVSFYRTIFSLDIPSDLDVPLGLQLSAPAGTVARVQIYINGYQYG